MADLTFRKGPPPHIGWWRVRNAQLKGDLRTWGWWDGRGWSYFTLDTFNAIAADIRARQHGIGYGSTGHVEWSDYWPEGARVPRLDPTGGHWTFHHGGPCPDFGAVERVQVCLRDGSRRSVDRHVAQELRWNHTRASVVNAQGDIVAWRKEC